MPKAKVTTNAIDSYISILRDLGENVDDIAGEAVYEGAGIIADAVRKNINTIRTNGKDPWETKRRELQKDGLRNGLTTFEITNVGGRTEGGVGFAGYNKRGQANRKVANAFNSGTSFSSKQPFFERALRASRPQARKRMAEYVEQEFEKIVKG